jgi:hypothetical protein
MSDETHEVSWHLVIQIYPFDHYYYFLQQVQQIDYSFDYYFNYFLFDFVDFAVDDYDVDDAYMLL